MSYAKELVREIRSLGFTVYSAKGVDGSVVFIAYRANLFMGVISLRANNLPALLSQCQMETNVYSANYD